MKDSNNIKLASIGLGYVGLPLAVEFGKKIATVGFDINAPRIAELGVRLWQFFVVILKANISKSCNRFFQANTCLFSFY